MVFAIASLRSVNDESNPAVFSVCINPCMIKIQRDKLHVGIITI